MFLHVFKCNGQTLLYLNLHLELFLQVIHLIFQCSLFFLQILRARSMILEDRESTHEAWITERDPSLWGRGTPQSLPSPPYPLFPLSSTSACSSSPAPGGPSSLWWTHYQSSWITNVNTVPGLTPGHNICHNHVSLRISRIAITVKRILEKVDQQILHRIAKSNELCCFETVNAFVPFFKGFSHEYYYCCHFYQVSRGNNHLIITFLLNEATRD